MLRRLFLAERQQVAPGNGFLLWPGQNLTSDTGHFFFCMPIQARKTLYLVYGCGSSHYR